MKKKSILVMVLAALMMFAFTACENNVPSYQAVQYVTVAQVADIIEGQTPYAEAFEVTVHYLDGTTDVFPGTGRVKFGTEGSNKTATATIAEQDDTVIVKFVKPEAITVTATVGAQTVSYTEGELPDFDIEATVTAATITAGNASWELDDTELANVEATAVLAGANRKIVGTHTSALKVTFDGESIATSSTVDIVVNDNPKDPNSPAYEETPDDPTKADVTKLGVKWTVTPAGKEATDAITYTTNNITVNVDDKVAYTIVGLTSDDKEVTLKPGDTQILAGNTLALTSGSYTTKKADITSEKVKALTATIQFVPDKDDTSGNYDKDIQLTLSVTVKDKLDESSLTSLTWKYDGKTSIEKVEGQGVTLDVTKFTAEAKTVGEEVVLLRGYEFYGIDETSWTADEVKESSFTTKNVNFRWNSQDSDYPAKGNAQNVSVTFTTPVDKG